MKAFKQVAYLTNKKLTAMQSFFQKKIVLAPISTRGKYIF
jgi:hypothetical protein